jgi:hypothetical protein
MILLKGNSATVADPYHGSGQIRFRLNGASFAAALPRGEMAGSSVTIKINR